MLIDREDIIRQLETGRQEDVDKILAKAEEGCGLSAAELASLLYVDGPRKLEEMENIAAAVRSAKGRNATLYTCLYITNECLNDCNYCGFRSSNRTLERITLSPDQIRSEARAIKDEGHKKVILIGGELREGDYIDLIEKGVDILQEEGLEIWLEFPNLSRRSLRTIHEKGVNHFVLFQETYDSEAYERVHRNTLTKSSYLNRLQSVEDAVDAGFKNMGIGALFGLTRDHPFEALGLYHHALSLMSRGRDVYISLPTLKPAPGVAIKGPMYRIEEDDLAKAAISLKLALPKVSLALSGREQEELRNRLFPIVDYIGCGGRTNPGARTSHQDQYNRGDKQFTLYDTRGPKEITLYLKGIGIEVN